MSQIAAGAENGAAPAKAGSGGSASPVKDSEGGAGAGDEKQPLLLNNLSAANSTALQRAVSERGEVWTKS